MALRLTTAPDLVEPTPDGLHCAIGGFHIDPWRTNSVERAIITHAHADHARCGMPEYLASPTCAPILQHRLGKNARITALPFGERITLGDTIVSLHPAGHILGSAQVRIEHARTGETWVITGDYKRTPAEHAADPTAEPFEPIRCHTLITESTFGLPIYRWPDPCGVHTEINTWWRDCQTVGRTALLYAYALGKAQRLLAGLDPSIGPILLHGATWPICDIYRSLGIDLPPYEHATIEQAKLHKGRAMVIAPPSAAASPWVRKFLPVSDAFASGWMMVRGMRRRRSVDRGFIISDHVDWPNLMATIRDTGCERVGVTHGSITPVVHYLKSQGLDAFPVPTRFVGESDDTVEVAANETSDERTDAGAALTASEEPR